jgi:MtN3 and saliva related transmembrane protein
MCHRSARRGLGSTDDLSLFMLATLTLGLGLWIIYGSIRGDWMIVAANGVGATLAAIVLGCKVRDLKSRGG